MAVLSFAVGVGLGYALAVLAAWAGIECRRRLIVGTLVFAIVTILSEHAWLYRDFRRQWREARDADAHVALFRAEEPWSPAEYFARELSPSRAALWCLDAAIVVGAAVGTVLILERRSANRAPPTRRSGCPTPPNKPLTPDP